MNSITGVPKCSKIFINSQDLVAGGEIPIGGPDNTDNAAWRYQVETDEWVAGIDSTDTANTRPFKVSRTSFGPHNGTWGDVLKCDPDGDVTVTKSLAMTQATGEIQTPNADTATIDAKVKTAGALVHNSEWGVLEHCDGEDWRIVLTVGLDTWTSNLGDIRVCLSLRKVVENYSGACLSVERSSDQTSQDINFNGRVLDKAQFDTFVGGSTATLVNWYDQTGNNHHFSATGLGPILTFETVNTVDVPILTWNTDTVTSNNTMNSMGLNNGTYQQTTYFKSTMTPTGTQYPITTSQSFNQYTLSVPTASTMSLIENSNIENYSIGAGDDWNDGNYHTLTKTMRAGGTQNAEIYYDNVSLDIRDLAASTTNNSNIRLMFNMTFTVCNEFLAWENINSSVSRRSIEINQRAYWENGEFPDGAVNVSKIEAVDTIKVRSDWIFNGCVLAQGGLKMRNIPAPTSSADPGMDGEIRWDDEFVYLYDGTQWRRSREYKTF